MTFKLGALRRLALRAVEMEKSDRKRQPEGQRDTRKAPRSDVDAAFDLWLQRGLHQLYDGVAAEPIPPELLQLIEEDKLRRRG